ncbi:hypothetical protein MKX03_018098 [Papaver bracteatum]|nr:hypothetical protein MKX03_018098 [Papaver bracteatum]
MAVSCSYSPTQICAASLSNSTMSLTKRPPSSYIRAGTKFPPNVPKELHFNHDGSATKKLQAGVDMVEDLVGVTLGPKGRNVVLQNKDGTLKMINDGVTVLKQEPLENVGAKLQLPLMDFTSHNLIPSSTIIFPHNIFYPLIKR